MTLFGGRASRELRISSGCFKSEIQAEKSRRQL